MNKDCSEIVSLINKGFLKPYNTILVGGFREPFYKAFLDDQPAQIQFTRDYIRSAVHELSHWCVAGIERRKIDDYGYWYTEDGRTQKQQNQFYKVEQRPQAIEWALSLLMGVEFEVSVDNLNHQTEGVDVFRKNVETLLKEYLNSGFTVRVHKLLEFISRSYNIEDYNQHILNSLM